MDSTDVYQSQNPWRSVYPRFGILTASFLASTSALGVSSDTFRRGNVVVIKFTVTEGVDSGFSDEKKLHKEYNINM